MHKFHKIELNILFDLLEAKITFILLNRLNHFDFVPKVK